MNGKDIGFADEMMIQNETPITMESRRKEAL